MKAVIKQSTFMQIKKIDYIIQMWYCSIVSICHKVWNTATNTISLLTTQTGILANHTCIFCVYYWTSVPRSAFDLKYLHILLDWKHVLPPLLSFLHIFQLNVYEMAIRALVHVDVFLCTSWLQLLWGSMSEVVRDCHNSNELASGGKRHWR